MSRIEVGRLCFFLGGRDLEMQTIAELLRSHVPAERIHDQHLQWGACASAYEREIRDAVEQGLVPVLIELAADVPLSEQVLIVDHHGERSGTERPTSLEQVFQLLGRPAAEWTRRMALVAANDRGHTRAMASLGATWEEMQAIRAADRRAQGITAEEEELAARSVQRAERLCSGRLTLVRLPHERAAAVADLMDPLLGGVGYENLLVCCPETVTFFGEGPVIESLRTAFPDGWWGGALPECGFWGGGHGCEAVLSAAVTALR